MRVVATYSIKGGVGKTSAAVVLGALAARRGRRTLLWDLDPQGGATFLLRVRPKVRGGGKGLVRRKHDPEEHLRGTDVEGLDLLPADFSLRHLDLVLDRQDEPLAPIRRVLDDLRDEFDLALLDCAPSVSLVSEAVFHAADLLLVPLVPSPLSVRTLDQLEAFLARAGDDAPAVLPFLSMVDRRRALHRELQEALPARFPAVARAAIPNAAAIELMGARREPLRAGPAARAYTALLDELEAALR